MKGLLAGAWDGQGLLTGQRVSFRAEENVLELGRGDGPTTL